MPHFDLKGSDLRTYRPELEVPDDLMGFWVGTLMDLPAMVVHRDLIDTGLRLIETYDVTYEGFAGAQVRGWLHVPAGAREPLPAVIQYIGYGGGRGLPHERLVWATAGYAHFVMDTRGQGSSSTVGHTSDKGATGHPSYSGMMTQGIEAPSTYYYRRLFTDAVRAVDAVRSLPFVDNQRIAVTGASQGGGIAIAAAALNSHVRYAMIDVPFLCDFPRALSITANGPYLELVKFLSVHRETVDSVLETLSYFDGAILGRQAKADALFSVGLMDETCPPSTVYAAYNWYGGSKAIIEYPYNNHEGGGPHHERRRLDWLAERVDNN